MSSGFGIDDVISVGKLCWELYSKVYKVSRDAPEELRGLSQELGNLHNTVQLLTEELKDEDSTLRQSGDIRISSVRRIMEQSKETLNKMQRLSEHYVELQTPADAREKRRAFRILWDQLKYSRELHNINDLRSKLMLHNSQLALILQGAQNSSLERIEKQNAQTDKKLDELRQLFISDRAARERPMLTAPLDQNTLIELTNIFLQKAELDNRPWASIGIDNWLQAGRWWLLKAQSQLDTIRRDHKSSTSYNQGYANLLKACWILADIIAIHPQRTHIGSSNDQRSYYIQRFTQVAISKMKTLQIEVPILDELRECDLNIWYPYFSTTVAPKVGGSANQVRLNWRTQDGEILFQRFAEYDSKLEPPVECIIILEILRGSNQVNLIAQSFMGQDIRRYEFNLNTPDDIRDADVSSIHFVDAQDMDLLLCILKSLERVRPSSLKYCTDASTMYWIIVLENCARFQYSLSDISNWSLMEEQIGLLMQSKPEAEISPTSPPSSLLQSIADRAINDIRQCSTGLLQYSNQIFWIQEHHCICMLICRFCNSLEEFLELWNLDGIPVIYGHCTGGCLIASGFYQRDVNYFGKFIPYIHSRAEWIFERNAQLASAICDNDIALLQTVLETKSVEDFHSLIRFLQLACANFKIDHMSLLLSKLVPHMRLTDVCQAISWLLTYHGERELQCFTDVLRSRVFNLPVPRGFAFDDCIAAKCAEIIQKRSLKKLRLFLDAIQRLDIPISTADSDGCGTILQLAILPALISRDLSMLEVLFEKNVVSTRMNTITFSEGKLNSDPRSWETIKTYPPQGMPHWPLYIAIRLVCDSSIVEYLCRAGACLEQVKSGSGDGEPEILRRLRAIDKVSAARDDFLSMRRICYILSLAGVRGANRNPFQPYPSPVIENGYKSFHRVWATTGQMMLEDGYYNFQGLTRSDITLLLGKDTQDFYFYWSGTWPTQLQTQQNWDKWRLEVVDILERAKRG